MPDGIQQPIECGNGVIEAGEQCDDGNAADDLCTSSCKYGRKSLMFSKLAAPSFDAMSFNSYGSGIGFYCGAAISYTCSEGLPSITNSALAFCDCLDNIADASGKTIQSDDNCPHNVVPDFWTSGGGWMRLATIGEITKAYEWRPQIAGAMVTGDYVWSCTEANSLVAPQGEDYGVMIMRSDGQASTNEYETYCGYPSYTQHYAMCVGVEY